MQTFSMLIHGVYIPVVAKKKNDLDRFKMIWLSSVLFHMLSRQAPAAATSPVLAYSGRFGGFLRRGLEADIPPGQRRMEGGSGNLVPIWQLRGFAFSSCLWILAQRVQLIQKGTNTSLFQYAGW